MRAYSTLEALHHGQVIDLDGIFLIKDGECCDIRSGDLYVAERNTGPKFLTCREVGDGCIHPKDFPAYSFDIGECVKVREATRDEVDREGAFVPPRWP